VAAYHQNINEFVSPSKTTPASPDPNITDPFAGQKEDLDDNPIIEDEIGGEEGFEGGNEMGGDF
jgi:hypothetical protein